MIRRVLALAMLLAAAVIPAAAAKKRELVPESAAPAWLQEAARRPTPNGANGFVVLHEEHVVEPLETGGYRELHRLAYRVLNLKSVEQAEYCGVQHAVADRAEIRGWLLLGDGRVQLPDRKQDIDDRPLVSFEVFSDSRALVLHQAGIEPGHVVGCETEVTRVLDMGGDEQVFGRLDHHTLASRATLRLPPGWSGDVVVRHEKGVVIERTEREITVHGENLAPFPERELRPSAEDVLPVARFRWGKPDGSRGFADWNAVSRFYNALEDPMLERLGEVEKIADRLKPATPDALLPAIAKAFDYAARDVRYVAISVGIGGFQPHAPADVARHAYGDCKDKAALLRAIFRRWGLRTSGVSVRTRSMGLLDADVPMNGVFDHEIAAVVLPEGVGRELWSAVDVPGVGRVLFLDATASLNPAWDLPEMDQGTIALLQWPDGAKLVRLPVQPPTASLRKTTLRARMDVAGTLHEAAFERTWTGNQGADIKAEWGTQTVEERSRRMTEILSARFPGAAMLERTVEGLENANDPVVLHAKLEGAAFGKRVGDLYVLEFGRAGGRVFSSRLPPAKVTWPIAFDAAFGDDVEVDIELPAGWKPESLPAPLQVTTAELVVKAAWTWADGHLVYRRDARLLEPFIVPERWAEVRDTALRVNAYDAASIVLVTK